MGQPFPPPVAPPPPPPPAPALTIQPVSRREPPLPPLQGRARHEMIVVGFMLAAPSLVFGLQGLGEAKEIDTDISYFDLAASVLSSFGPALLCGFLLWRDGVLGQSMFKRRSGGFIVGWGSLTFVCIFGAALVGGIIITIIQAVLDSDAS